MSVTENCPYKQGFTAVIRCRWPGPPFEREYTTPYPPPEARLDPEYVTRRLDVVGRLFPYNTGHKGAHLLRCRIDAGGQTVIAKVFDPRYFDYDSEEHQKYFAELGYTKEANAYEKLWKKGLDGKLTPKYYGSWEMDEPVIPKVAATGQMPNAAATVQTVHLVLMQEIPGKSMLEIHDSGEVHKIPIDQRLEMVAQTMEIKSQLAFHGVRHGNDCLRNIMVAGLSNAAGVQVLPRMYAIDFHMSDIHYSPCRRHPIILKPLLPKNPILEHWNRVLGYSYWIPKNYQTNKRAWNGWLLRRWGEAKGYAEFRRAAWMNNYVHEDPIASERP